MKNILHLLIQQDYTNIVYLIANVIKFIVF